MNYARCIDTLQLPLTVTAQVAGLYGVGASFENELDSGSQNQQTYFQG